ncbi:MAG: nucleotidyltransferase domain-containing protein [Anaerolineaceae bacterium]|nr:nucleotidyltransferase domain-containing protein [Anaerolineaceae bacterium]
MHLTPTLLEYQAESEHFLESALTALKQDERVQAAWVLGSLGRGDADALSDIDLVVVVQDDFLRDVITGRYDFARQVGEPLFFLEAPRNAPPGGAYLMVCYDAPVAPHILDIYWQDRRPLAWDASQLRLLFQRSSDAQSLPAKTGGGKPTVEDKLQHEIHYFWMMLLIVAKYVCRDPHAAEMHLLQYLPPTYESARAIVGNGEALDADILSAAVYEPEQKLRMLRYLAESMNALVGQGHEQTCELITSAVSRYLNMVEQSVMGESAAGIEG